MKCQWVLSYGKRLKRLIYVGYYRTKQYKCLVFEKESKANVNWFERKSAKLRKVREYFIKLKIPNEGFS